MFYTKNNKKLERKGNNINICNLKEKYLRKSKIAGEEIDKIVAILGFTRLSSVRQ